MQVRVLPGPNGPVAKLVDAIDSSSINLLMSWPLFKKAPSRDCFYKVAFGLCTWMYIHPLILNQKNQVLICIDLDTENR